MSAWTRSATRDAPVATARTHGGLALVQLDASGQAALGEHPQLRDDELVELRRGLVILLVLALVIMVMVMLMSKSMAPASHAPPWDTAASSQSAPRRQCLGDSVSAPSE